MWLGIPSAVSHWGRYSPSKVAIRSNGASFSYSQLSRDSSRICSGLLVAALKTDHPLRIAVVTENNYLFIVAIVAVLQSGHSVVVVPRSLPGPHLETLLTDASPNAVLWTRSTSEKLPFIQLLSDIPALAIDDLVTDDTLEYTGTVQEATSSEWGIVFSSGSTGPPKAVVHDIMSMTSEFLAWHFELGLSRATTFYIARPLFYTGGLVLTLATMLAGGTVIANDHSDYSDFGAIWNDYQTEARENHVHWAFFVPDQLRTFIRICKELAEPISHADSILVMGAPISGDEKLSARELLNSNIIESWGNSEGLGTITEPDDLNIRPDSIGRPFLTEKLLIVNDRIEVCDPFAIGRIAGADEILFSGYAGRPEASDLAKRNQLVLSDDLGYVDNDGYFYHCGRTQDCVTVDGKSVFLTQIASVLRSDARVLDAVVCARNRGEKVCLTGVAVISPSAVPDEVVTACNANLRPEQRLEALVPVSSIPRLPSGKVDVISVNAIAHASDST